MCEILHQWHALSMSQSERAVDSRRVSPLKSLHGFESTLSFGDVERFISSVRSGRRPVYIACAIVVEEACRSDTVDAFRREEPERRTHVRPGLSAVKLVVHAVVRMC